MTQTDQPVDGRGAKLLGATSVKVRLAFASAAILVTGTLIAPRAEPTGLTTPQELVAPLLGEQVQLREAPLPFRGVQPVAGRVREHVVAIPPGPSHVTATFTDFSALPRHSPAAGFGVFVSDHQVLTHALALDGRTAVQVAMSDGTVLDAQVAAFDTSTELALLQMATTDRPPARLARESPVAGALAVAIGRWNQADIAVPVFVTSGGDPLIIQPGDGSVLPGMPLFNLDGELFAIADGTQRRTAFPVREAATRLMSRAAAGERLASLGLVFQDRTALLARAFGEKGVLISDVVDGGPAHQADVRVGDVLVAVGDTQIESADTAAHVVSQLPTETTTPLRVIRSGRERIITVTVTSAYGVAALARSRDAHADAGRDARALFSAPVLERAGIHPTARVLTVNGQVVSSRAQIERLLRTTRRPVAVLLRDGGTQFFVAIEPGR